MNSLDLYRDAVRRMEDMEHPVLKLAYPRKTRIPPGFFSPKFLICPALGSACYMHDHKPEQNPTIATQFVVIQRLIEYGVPTYFAGENLCASLATTNPPEDMKLSEIKWAFPAILIELGEKFSLSYVGRKVLWMAAARIEPNTEIDCKYEFVRPFAIPSRETSISIAAEVIEPDGRIASFHGNIRESTDVAGIMETPIDFYPSDPEYEYLREEICGPSKPLSFDPKTDREIFNRMASIFINLLMVMTARPEMVSTQEVNKQIKGRKEGEKIDLWEPRWIGQGYRPPTSRAENGGTHASPRVHFRRGHWRNQAVGEGHKERKLTWIEMMIVGADDEGVDGKAA